MTFENPVLISFILFIIVLISILWLDRKNLKLKGFVLMRKTQKGKIFIDKVAKKYKPFWNFLSFFSVVVSIIVVFLSSFFLINNSFAIFNGSVSEGVKLVLPWPSSEAVSTPGVLGVPWYFWIIGILSVVVPHEFMHGVMCRIDKIKIKSMGFILFLFIPGAFVEPDEKQLKKASRKTKLKVYSIGSFSNFVLAIIFSIVSLIILSIFYSSSGILPSGYIEGYPISESNISGAITEINGIPINSIEKLSSTLDKIPPNTKIQLQTTTGQYEITTAKHPELDKSFIGVQGPFIEYMQVSENYKNQSLIIEFIKELLFWIVILNFGIGLVNLLPIKPLDGGLFFEELVGKFFKNPKPIVNVVSIFMLFVLIFNLIGPFII